jgi:hypothetical protein
MLIDKRQWIWHTMPLYRAYDPVRDRRGIVRTDVGDAQRDAIDMGGDAVVVQKTLAHTCVDLHGDPVPPCDESGRLAARWDADYHGCPIAIGTRVRTPSGTVVTIGGTHGLRTQWTHGLV